jgi:hypothetical protein
LLILMIDYLAWSTFWVDICLSTRRSIDNSYDRQFGRLTMWVDLALIDNFGLIDNLGWSCVDRQFVLIDNLCWSTICVDRQFGRSTMWVDRQSGLIDNLGWSCVDRCNGWSTIWPIDNVGWSFVERQFGLIDNLGWSCVDRQLGSSYLLIKSTIRLNVTLIYRKIVWLKIR